MEEKTTISPLIYMAFGMALIILVGIITLRKPSHNYALSVEETHAYILEAQHAISPQDASTIANDKLTSFQFIDLRDEIAYGKGAVPGAINLPQHSLLMEESYGLIEGLTKDSVTIILYGADGLQANGPWMILSQLGFNNIRVLTGGYPGFSQTADTSKTAASSQSGMYTDVARYDYQGIIDAFVAQSGRGGGSAAGAERVKRAEKVVPAKKAKQSAVEGGC